MSHSHHGHGSGMNDPIPIASSTMEPMMTTTTDSSDHSGHHGHHDMSGMSAADSSEQHHNMNMHMYFHGGDTETILFAFWKISTPTGLFASMVAIFFLAFCYEALKFYREHLYRHSFQTVQVNTISLPVENGGAMKETHKTVQISSPTCASPYAPPEVNPIFISRSSCECPNPNPTRNTTGDDVSDSTSYATSAPIVPANCQGASTTKVIVPPRRSMHYKVKMLSCMHIWQTCLHVVQVILSYFLMLIFMTYNVWLCLAVAVGAGAGYFFFGWKKSLVVDITEHCH